MAHGQYLVQRCRPPYHEQHLLFSALLTSSSPDLCRATPLCRWTCMEIYISGQTHLPGQWATDATIDETLDGMLVSHAAEW